MNTPALTACALVALASHVFSQSVTWETTGSNDSGDFGNTLLFHDSGRDLAVSSWGHTRGGLDDAFEAARGSVYTIGMGVSNADEGTGTNDHQMDNAGGDDWMLFSFDSAVSDVRIVIDPYGTWDRDVTYYTANLSGPVELTGLTYANLSALGFSARTDNFSIVSESSREIAINNPPGEFNTILFGAWQGEPVGDSVDRFKISSVSATLQAPAAVPEPSAALLGAIGILGLLRRRSR